MIESPFASAPPMWSLPPAGFAIQAPVALASRPAAPLFAQSPIVGSGSGLSTAAPGFSAPAPPQSAGYGYGGGMMTVQPPGLYGLTAGSSLAAGSLAPAFVPVVTDALAGVPAPALLAAVALRRGQPHGPATDQDAEDFIYDAFELLPGAGDVEVRCENGRATLTGSVPHKRVKRDVGEVAWAIPGLQDVQNNVTIASRRRSRAASGRDEPSPGGQTRKQA